MPTQSEIQDAITARIIEGLENGVIPWRKPWINDPNCGSPVNAISLRNYSGINPYLCDLSSQVHGFTSTTCDDGMEF
jgi:antirestriction protein ArdC